jgi:NAD(P)-dependent dehydrogenase (short-subunit alcohol dehydrogenase family)
MKKSGSGIALITPVNNEASLACAQLLAAEGFKLAITGSVQEALTNAVEIIGNGVLGVLNSPENLAGLLPIYKKVTCYFNGRIDFLIINTVHGYVNGLIDYTEAFFMAQYALPFLKPKATVLFNTVTLTKRDLDYILSQPAKPTNSVNIFRTEEYKNHTDNVRSFINY